MQKITFVLVLIALVVTLAACSNVESKKVIVNDRESKVYLRGFNIVCDTEKHMGIAYVGSKMSDPDADSADYNVGGMLTPAQYAEWCAPLESE